MSLRVVLERHVYPDGQPVLRNLDLEIRDGESVALTGPSGSGKTTLLSVLGLLQVPSAGQVLLDDQPVPTRGTSRRVLQATQFAWVFQTVNVLGRRTSLDNVTLGQLPRSVTRSRADIRSANALELVGLGNVRKRPAHSLSGGELQRVCIARAIAARARYIMADEPTGQLDRATSEVVADALFNIPLLRSSLVIATHDPNLARRCDRVFEIRDARLREQ